MRILSWNINGIRAARRDKSLKEVLDSLEADVICLQETKVTREMLDEVTAVVDGYNAYFSFSKVKTGYSGVATFCRNSVTPVAAEEGLSASLNPQPTIGCYGSTSDFTSEELEALDAEGRAVLTEHSFPDGKNVVIINVYCPRADKENKDRVNFKLRFYKLLQERAEALVKERRHVIVLGDINTAHKMIDHCDPDEEDVFNTHPGRQWLNHFLLPHDAPVEPPAGENSDLLPVKGKMFIDTFRYFHSTERGAYTNWCTVTSARQTNYGTRIDYIFADVELVRKEFEDCVIRPDVDGSDHCPVVATLKTSFEGASKPPALCTKYMPEFAGKQQKLKEYFAKHSGKTRASSQPNSRNNESQEVMSLKRSASFGDEKNKVKRQKTAGTKTKAASQPKTNLFSFFSRPSSHVSSEKKATQIIDPRSEYEATHDHVSCTSKASELPKSTPTLRTNSVANVDQPKKFTDQAIHSSDRSACHHTAKDDSTSVDSNSQSEGIVLPSSTESTSSKDCSQKRKAEVALWKTILTGPRPAPLCSGHKEPCVLRTVKVKGPNQGKQFYCCAKPQGHSSNPQARCNFFKWVKQG